LQAEKANELEETTQSAEYSAPAINSALRTARSGLISDDVTSCRLTPQFSALSSGDRVPEKDDQGMKSTAHDSDKHSVVDENHRAVFSVRDRNGEADRKPRPWPDAKSLGRG